MNLEYKCKCGAVLCYFTDNKKVKIARCPFCSVKINLKNKEDIVFRNDEMKMDTSRGTV